MASAVTKYMKGGPPLVCAAITLVTMDDFANIPPVGDALVYASDEETKSECESDVEELQEQKDGKYRFNGKHIYVTWSKSKIDSKEEFHEKLMAMLPAGVKMFGGRELHQDGTPHYHVVFSFAEKMHWRDAAKKFSIEGDTNAIRFEKPKPRQRLSDFLENTMAYCAKDGNTFGERLSLEGAVAEQKKRKRQEAIDESEEDKAWAIVRELDPRAYMVNHPALDKAISKKRCTNVASERDRPKGKFRVLKRMEWWMNKYVVRREWKGRPKSLVVVGDPMVGKTAWAESQGNPIVMNSTWCMSSIFSGATHIVVNDVKPAAFGYGGISHWRDVLGGQERFNARDFQQPTRTIEWGLPCIWTCNFDNDPRKDKGVADYIRKVAYVVEVRDRSGQRDWGKLYEPVKEDEEEDDEEPLEALEEANYYLDTGYVDEA